MVPGTSRITLPKRFDKILGNTSLGNGIRLYVQRFDAWVSDDTKGLFFFPEYTDHGPKHITSVLFGAEALIREEAWKAITPEDVAVLTAAALFHDAAMHLSADGFLALIDPKGAGERPLIRPLDTQTWPELFAAYYSEVRKWDQRRLHRILGDEKVPHEEEPDLIDSVCRPEEMPNPETWSTRYRKFLGEFVRRHHARLAHEIALYGYPGHTSDALKLPEELDRLTDLAGLVARSHNMHLRDTFDYLKEKYDRRVECLRTHPVFLMVILRIADYLEIRSERTNPTAHAIQRLRSPISFEEHSNHLAVHDVQWPDEDDEEAVFVSAQPESARLFLKMQSLLKGLQAELDTSWAVLGEVYSKQQKFSSFGITLRRVRSNLDSPTEYMQRRNPDYFPVRAAFDTTGADLLKLLIKPLYGDRPEIGVRELLQNALDAVHELRQWAADHGDPEMKAIPLSDQEADVLISVDKDEAGDAWLTVRDKGIGMTVEVVRDYFLKAGASYRESPAWRKEFEREDGAKVLRSGRFGVGALAAFLLGKQIEVVTRYVTSPIEDGIRFTASIRDDVIELNRATVSVIGTMVRVRLTGDALEELVFASDKHQKDRWDWFTLDDPVVERRVYGKVLEQALRLSPSEKGRRDGWCPIVVPGFRSILWTFDDRVPELTCNGVVVKVDSDDHAWAGEGLPFASPVLSVFDPNGLLPLNLQRDDLMVGWPPFWDQLVAELARELCAFLLMHAPTESLSLPSRRSIYWRTHHPPILKAYRLLGRNGCVWPICFTKDGTALFREDLVGEEGQSCLCLSVDDSFIPGKLLLSSSLVSFIFAGDYSNAAHTARFLSHHFSRATPRILARIFHNFGLGEGTVLGEEWAIFEPHGPCSSEHLLEAFYAQEELRKPHLQMAMEWRLDSRRPSDNRFDQIYCEIMDSPIIPYDPAERRRKLPNAFAQLEKYLKRWEPENLAGWRLDMVRWFRGEPVEEE